MKLKIDKHICMYIATGNTCFVEGWSLRGVVVKLVWADTNKPTRMDDLRERQEQDTENNKSSKIQYMHYAVVVLLIFNVVTMVTIQPKMKLEHLFAFIPNLFRISKQIRS